MNVLLQRVRNLLPSHLLKRNGPKSNKEHYVQLAENKLKGGLCSGDLTDRPKDIRFVKSVKRYGVDYGMNLLRIA